MHTTRTNPFIFALTLILLVVPSITTAASLYIDTDHTEFFVGDTVLLRVRINTEGKTVNALEGAVSIDHESDTASLADLNTAGSVFSLWPGRPLPSERNTRVSFTGGSPAGVTASDANVFTMVLTLDAPGTIALSPQNVVAYLHDGKGTRTEVTTKDLVIQVQPKKPGTDQSDDWRALLAKDTTPPEPFEVFLAQDPAVFDGLKFISFNTTDSGSGISHYEVLEGSLPPVRSNDTYVLREQQAPTSVKVIAYDAAGNKREAQYQATAGTGARSPLGWVIGIVVLVVILILARKVRRRRRA